LSRRIVRRLNKLESSIMPKRGYAMLVRWPDWDEVEDKKFIVEIFRGVRKGKLNGYLGRERFGTEGEAMEYIRANDLKLEVELLVGQPDPENVQKMSK